MTTLYFGDRYCDNTHHIFCDNKNTSFLGTKIVAQTHKHAITNSATIIDDNFLIVQTDLTNIRRWWKQPWHERDNNSMIFLEAKNVFMSTKNTCPCLRWLYSITFTNAGVYRNEVVLRTHTMTGSNL